MSETIAVFGAGPGLGRSAARRFGREGFRVALVARTPARLDTLVSELSGQGIEAAGFPADLADPAAVPGTVQAITDRFGPVDVLEYAPAGLDLVTMQAGVLDAGPDAYELPLTLLLRTPVALVQQVLPGMIERDRGAVLFGLAVSASHPYPQVATVGTAGAAARAYLHNLHVALAGTGVYAGLVQVGGMILGSEAAGWATARFDPAQLPPPLDPDDLAQRYWDLYTQRDRFEETVRSNPA